MPSDGARVFALRLPCIVRTVTPRPRGHDCFSLFAVSAIAPPRGVPLLLFSGNGLVCSWIPVFAPRLSHVLIFGSACARALTAHAVCCLLVSARRVSPCTHGARRPPTLSGQPGSLAFPQVSNCHRRWYGLLTSRRLFSLSLSAAALPFSHRFSISRVSRRLLLHIHAALLGHAVVGGLRSAREGCAAAHVNHSTRLPSDE